MRRLETHKIGGPNSLMAWRKKNNVVKSARNFIVIHIAKYIASNRLKILLLKSIGIKIGKNTSIGLLVQFDVFYPHLIEIGENCIIGYNTTFLTHEFLIEKYKTGKIEIGNNVMIGANTTILAGIKIDDNATVSAMTLVNKDVDKGSFVGGVPCKEIKRNSK